MSVVACCIKNRRAVIGSDSIVVNNNGDISHIPTKLIHKDNYILGYVGSISSAQALEYIEFPKFKEITKKEIYQLAMIIRETGTNVVKKYEDILPQDNGIEVLVLTKNKIYHVDSYSGIASFDHIMAIGSGGAFAHGYMQALYSQNLTARELVKRAIHETFKVNAYCGGTPSIMEL